MTVEEGAPPRRTDARRWKKEISDGLASLPREHEALEYAMAEFGASFELKELTSALRPDADVARYSKVQALERAVTRIQNILADVARAGVKLGGLPLPAIDAGLGEKSFVALGEGGVIPASLCKRLRNAQRMRNLIEHDYDKVTAGRLHKVAEEARDLVPEFIRPFRNWIEPRL